MIRRSNAAEIEKQTKTHTTQTPGLSGWVSALKTPLAEVVGDAYTLFPGYENRRLFAINLLNEWEFHVGTLDENGDIIDDLGNAVGRLVGDIDFYIDIIEPNALAQLEREK